MLSKLLYCRVREKALVLLVISSEVIPGWGATVSSAPPHLSVSLSPSYHSSNAERCL